MVKESAFEGERIAKAMARAGLCSRRDAERLITEGRVRLNGKVLASPAVNVTAGDDIQIDGKPLPRKEDSRLWRYHKPAGLVTSHKDPEGRRTVFDALRDELPRVISIGRLDINTEGLLLLTNDGELARLLELPATGWVRRYRVRAYGRADQQALERLTGGLTIEGVHYGPIEARIDKMQGDNAWLTIAIREGKNREVKKICEYLGLQVNRLIRTAFGPFQLGDLERGRVAEVPARVLAEQLGRKMSAPAGKAGPGPATEHAARRGRA
jgi:23S rRNA pseudouridine2605 synthase